jgi:hypothetical protein
MAFISKITVYIELSEADFKDFKQLYIKWNSDEP